jgi:phage regulator Rha-like protein
MFQLSQDEFISLRLQNETLKKGRGQHRKYFPYAFTEQGLAMLSGVLNSDKAIEVNLAIMRAFVLMRQYALSHKDLTLKLKELEEKHDMQFKDVYEALHFLLQKNQKEEDQKDRARVGFK